MASVREKFSSQADPQLLSEIRALAQKQGRQFQAVIEQALTEYLGRNQTERARIHVLEVLGMSMEEFDDLYQKLAK